MTEQKATYTLAEYEDLQYRYDSLREKLGNAQERIEELEMERDGLKEQVQNARILFREMSESCDEMLREIKSKQQHI